MSIRIRAAGAGIWDSKQREGDYATKNAEFPMILGAVETSLPGKQGAYAQYVAAKAIEVAERIV